jgi:hypothetical protein
MSNKLFATVLIFSAAQLAFAQPASLQQQPTVLPQLQPASVLSQSLPGAGVMSVSPNALKYRDSSKPLTVGEMSDMAALKAQTDFLQRQGYSTQEPPKTVNAPVERPSLRIQSLAHWGSSANQAEIMVNGRLMRVRGGEVLGGGVSVDSVTPQGVTLSIDASKGRNKRGAIKRRDVTLKMLKTGQSTDIQL